MKKIQISLAVIAFSIAAVGVMAKEATFVTKYYIPVGGPVACVNVISAPCEPTGTTQCQATIDEGTTTVNVTYFDGPTCKLLKYTK